MAGEEEPFVGLMIFAIVCSCTTIPWIHGMVSWDGMWISWDGFMG